MKKGVKLWKINQIHSRSFFTFIAWSHYFSDRSRTDNYLHKATCRYKLEQTSLPVPSHPLNMNWVKQYTSILFTAAVVSLALISLKYTESKNSKPVFKPRQPATAPPPLDFWCSKREHQPCPFDPSFFQAARLCAIYAALCLSASSNLIVSFLNSIKQFVIHSKLCAVQTCWAGQFTSSGNQLLHPCHNMLAIYVLLKRM